MKEKIIFSTFDFRKGPIIVYQTGIGEDLAENIAVKTLTSSLSMSTSYQSDFQQIESISIVPIQTENLLAFTYFFPLLDPTYEEKIRISSISILFWEYQRKRIIDLLDIIENESKLVANYIQIHFTFGQPPTDELILKLTNLAQLSQLNKEEIQILLKERQKSTDLSSYSISLNNLLSQFPKGLVSFFKTLPSYSTSHISLDLAQILAQFVKAEIFSMSLSKSSNIEKVKKYNDKLVFISPIDIVTLLEKELEIKYELKNRSFKVNCPFFDNLQNNLLLDQNAECVLLRVFIQTLIDNPNWYIEETSCIGRGDPYCEYSIIRRELAKADLEEKR